MLKKLILMLLLFPALAFSESEGEKLVNKFWKYTVAKRIHKIASTMSPHFQGMYVSSLCADGGGSITKQQELQYLLSSNITGFILSNVQTTKNDHIMVVTYDIQLFTTIPAAHHYKTPTPDPTTYYHEIFVYSKRVDQWKLVGISFFPFNTEG